MQDYEIILHRVATAIKKGEAITADSLWKSARFDSGIIPPEFLASGPKGQDLHLLSAWIDLFIKDANTAFGMHPDAIYYFDWDQAYKNTRRTDQFAKTKEITTVRGQTSPKPTLKAEFLRAKETTTRPKPQFSNPPPENASFIVLLQYIINRSGLYDREAAMLFKICPKQFSMYVRGLMRPSQIGIEAIIATLEADLGGQTIFTAYEECRDRLRSFSIPEPPEGCRFGELLRFVIAKSLVRQVTAARLLELSSKSLGYILNNDNPRNPVQNIVGLLDMDLEGTKRFSAYGEYQERFKAYLPKSETFEQILDYIIAESSVSIITAAKFLGVSKALGVNLRGRTIRPAARQNIYNGLEKDLKGDKYFSAYEKYRDHIESAIRGENNEEVFHALLHQTITESGRSIAFAERRFCMSPYTLGAKLAGNRSFTREVAQNTIDALDADMADACEFSAYPRYRERLKQLAGDLKTHKKTHKEAPKKCRPLEIACV